MKSIKYISSEMATSYETVVELSPAERKPSPV